MINKIRQLVQKNNALRKFIVNTIMPTGILDSYVKNYSLGADWKRRNEDILSSADNLAIPRHPNAGQIRHGKQVMHNGIEISLGSYYGFEISTVLQNNKGVHEPQEERVFQEVLKEMPQGATMLELGAFWAFYSMWFQKEVPNAKNYMIEPSSFNLVCGQKNFQINKMKGHFTQGFIGAEAGTIDGVPIICVDDFCKQHNIPFLDILHSDIQGYEYEMLLGAIKTIKARKIKYFFISTHNDTVHGQCVDFLLQQDYEVLVNINLQETCSVDGLIVARGKEFQGANFFEYTRKI